MKESIEIRSKSKEDAISQAIEELKVSEKDLQIETVQ